MYHYFVWLYQITTEISSWLSTECIQPWACDLEIPVLSTFGPKIYVKAKRSSSILSHTVIGICYYLVQTGEKS